MKRGGGERTCVKKGVEDLCRDRKRNVQMGSERGRKNGFLETDNVWEGRSALITSTVRGIAE